MALSLKTLYINECRIILLICWVSLGWASWCLGPCYKNTAIIYHGKIPQYKTLLFLGLKYHGNLLSYCSYLLSFQGKFNVINVPMVIYCHSTIITKVMLLYNTEWWYDHGMAVNYCGKKFYNIWPGPTWL